jgi:hypothetical protein
MDAVFVRETLSIIDYMSGNLQSPLIFARGCATKYAAARV